jgi:Kef-type K+ transport system membrane component KefB
MEKQKKPILKFEEHFYRTASFLIGILFIVLIIYVAKDSFAGHVSEEKKILFEIVFLLLVAVLAEAAVLYFKMENVVLLMILGVLLSPSVIGKVIPSFPSFSNEVIRVFSELGAIILLFKVGLHSKVDKVFSKVNLLVAISGIIVPFAVGYFFAIGSDNFSYAMFMGAALAATSVGVTVAILKSMNVLNKRFSEIIIGAAIIDDILALLLLSVVKSMAGGPGEGISVFMTLVLAAIFILGAIVTGKFIIEYIDRKDMGVKRFLISIAYMLFMGYVAESIGLSVIIGAFIAGIVLNKSKNLANLEEKTFGLEYMFMPIFFISLGLIVDIGSILSNIVPIIIITVLAVLSKIIGCGIMAFASGINFKESFVVGVGMAPRGEVALIVASIGLSGGILTVSQYSLISAMALITSFIVPFILPRMIKSL